MVVRDWGVVGGLSGLVGLLAVVAIVLAVRSGHAAGPPVPVASLADRVNAACGRLEMVDWTVGSEWERLAPGTVRVSCMRPDGTLVYRAVAR